MLNGIVVVNKPRGVTSSDCVYKLRKILQIRKIGHAGTLDPFATGLLILCVGKETKNAMSYTKLDKVYEATVRLGQTSTTGDPEGEVSDVSDAQPSRDDIEKVLKMFVGEITQRPPIYSAIKVNGQRAYDLARAGKEVEIPERQVTIHSLEIIDYTYPNLTIRTHVSSGTYIRTLAEDIGKTLGTGAYCTQLRRTKVADWDVANAQTLSDFGVDS